MEVTAANAAERFLLFASITGCCTSTQRVAEFGSLGGIAIVYSMLTGQVVGLSLGLLGHLVISGSFRPSVIYAIPLIAVFVLFAAVDAESFFPAQWKQQISSRLATGKLRRSFCFLFGVGIGIAIYPIEWFICRYIFDDAVRARMIAAIALAVLLVAASAFTGWYLLTKYPRTNDAA